MKKYIVLVVLLTTGFFTARGQEYTSLYSERTNFIADLALIYQGGTHRPDWNTSQLQPYVFQKGERKTSWLFDGFLFIEFKDNLGYEYAKGYGNKPAGKAQWSWLLERNFENGKALPALNFLMDSLAFQGSVPLRKRQVVLTLPEPILNASEWGNLNGRSIDFARNEDRVAACKWFIDEAITKWAGSNLSKLEFSGFYWVAEQSKGSVDILPQISEYIHSKGLKFYWIPYWKASGSGDWEKAGFDVAYQQPNHFFGLKTPDTRLPESTAFAKMHGMGMEMEFDMNVQKPEFERRFYAYLKVFKKDKVLRDAAMAYYEGGGAVYKLAQHTDENMRKIYSELCEVIKSRQKKADRLAVKGPAR